MSFERIAIIGAGPAGLTLAKLLEMKGLTTTVFERDVFGSPQRGGSLDLKPEMGLLALESAGLDKAFYSIARRIDVGLSVVDPESLEVFHKVNTSENPEIDRVDLRELLVKSISPSVIHWGKQLLNVSEKKKEFELHFSDGSSTVADFVVGADGLNSRIRANLTSAMPTFIGITIAEVAISKPFTEEILPLNDLLGEGSLVAEGGGIAVWIQRTTIGGIRAYYSFPVEHKDVLPSRSQIKQIFESFSKVLTAPLDDADSTLRAWPLFAYQHDQSWQTHHGITLIGDAAHVMPPFTGAGVNLAMKDALDLADILPDGDQDAFERAMCIRAGVHTLKTIEVAKARYGSTVIYP